MPLVVFLLVIAVVVYFALRRPSAPAPDPDELELRLLHLCLGDRALRDRLVVSEQARAPGISREQAVDRAYAHLCRAKR